MMRNVSCDKCMRNVQWGPKGTIINSAWRNKKRLQRADGVESTTEKWNGTKVVQLLTMKWYLHVCGLFQCLHSTFISLESHIYSGSSGKSLFHRLWLWVLEKLSHWHLGQFGETFIEILMMVFRVALSLGAANLFTSSVNLLLLP